MFSFIDPQNLLHQFAPLRPRRPPNLPQQPNPSHMPMDNSRQQNPTSSTAPISRLPHNLSNSALARLSQPSRTSSHPTPQRDPNLLRKPHLPHIHHHISNPNPVSTTKIGEDREKAREKVPQEEQTQPDEPQQQHHRSRRHRHSTTHAHRHKHHHHHHNTSKGVPQSANVALKSPSWTELLRSREGEARANGGDGGSMKDSALERWKTERGIGELVRVEDVENERGKRRRREE